VKEEPVTDALLRQFLLGKVDDEERQRIESLFVSDRLSRDSVLAAEQELIDDYLEDMLSPADRESFLLRYGNTPEQQRKLRIAKSIQELASRTPDSIEAGISTVWTRVLERVRLRPVFVIPVAVTFIMAIMITAVWYLKLQPENKQHLVVEQELARLNSPASLSQTPPGTSVLVLRPISVRSAETRPEFVPGADTRFVELRLIWIRKERCSTYQAVIRRSGDEESFAVRQLEPQTESGELLHLRLPADMLMRGLYQVELSGVGSDGAIGPSEEYTFTVSR
jgi:hypothetical protein